MQSALTAKEQLDADTPLFFFDCTLADGTVRHWSSRTITWNGTLYEGRVVRQNLFEAQLASDTQVGGPPKLTFELANADSELSEIEQQTGFKGAQLIVQPVFFDLATGVPDERFDAVVFRGLMNPPDTITETTFRLSAMNRISMQRTVIPNVRVERMCPWRFPNDCGAASDSCRWRRSAGKVLAVLSLRIFARSGQRRGQSGWRRAVHQLLLLAFGLRTAGHVHHRYERAATGAFRRNRVCAADDSGARRGPEEFPAFRRSGKHRELQRFRAAGLWHAVDHAGRCFFRNDGNLTRMEVLLGMGRIQGILTVLVDDIQIPQGVNGEQHDVDRLVQPG